MHDRVISAKSLISRSDEKSRVIRRVRYRLRDCVPPSSRTRVPDVCTRVPDTLTFAYTRLAYTQAVDHPALKLFPLYYGSNSDEKSFRASTRAETNTEMCMHKIKFNRETFSKDK